MSLVLAFGLSPLGQVPAYADEGLQSQAASLQAQDDHTFKSLVYTVTPDGTASVNPTMTYSGKGQLVAFQVRDGESALLADGGASVAMELYAPGKAPGTDEPMTKTGDMSTKAADSVTTAGVNSPYYTVTEAGTYTVVVKGQSTSATYKGLTETFTFEIGKLDISKLGQANTKTKFAIVQANGNGYVNNKLTYNGSDQKVQYGVVNSNDLTASTDYALLAGTDFNASIDTVNAADNYEAVLTGKGSCTGQVTVPIEVATVPFIATTSSKAVVDDAKVNGADIVKVESGDALKAAGSKYPGNDYSAGIYKIESGPTVAADDPVEVKLEDASDPLKVTYKGVELAKGDYKVKYFAKDEDGDIDRTTTLAKPLTEKGNVYFAEVTVNNKAKFTTSATFVVKLAVGGGSALNTVVKTAKLADGTYLGGSSAAASKEGATFLAEDGKTDLSDLVGENFAWDTGNYGILGTNQAPTAQIKGGKPVGAGDYFVKVVGDGDFAAGTAFDATYTVKKAKAVEGEGVGELDIDIVDQPYNDGNYVDPQPKVKMYINKKGETATVDAKVDAAATSTGSIVSTSTGPAREVVNWTVTYFDKDGAKVSLPKEVGDYTAEFSFGGNFEEAKITKSFKVETGDISGKVAYIGDASKVFTGKAVELTDKDVKFYGEDDAAVSADDLGDYTLEYAKGSASSSLDADGKPLTAGTYTVRATFAGKYQGTVEGTLTVERLDLANFSNAEVQYLQEDGSYDTVLSVAQTGSAITPSFRIAVIDKKERTDKPTLVDESVYAAEFSDNTDPGTAKLLLSAANGNGTNLRVAYTAKDAFTIAYGSLAGAEVKFVDDEDSADYTKLGVEGPTVQVKADPAGTLSYVQTNSKGQIMGTAIDGSTDPATEIPVYKDGSDWKKVSDASVVTVSGGITAINVNEGYGYSLRVIDPDGYEMHVVNGMTDAQLAAADYGLGTVVTIARDEADNTKVKIGQPAAGHKYNPTTKKYDASGAETYNEFVKAGEYQIVAGAGTDGQYGGRVVGKFTVKALDITSSNFAITYTTPATPAKTAKGTKANTVLGADEAWDIDYDAAAAATKAGITLAGIAVKPATAGDPLVLDTDFTVKYEGNKAAGEATVTIAGKGNYGGELTRAFTINKGTLSNASKATFNYDADGNRGDCTSAGYYVDFDEDAFVKNAKNQDVIVFTGSQVTPAYEVNYYIDRAYAIDHKLYKMNAAGKAIDANGADISGNTDTTWLLTVDLSKPYTTLDSSEFEPQWFNNTNVYYPDGSAFPGAGAQLLVKASGNYEGSLTQSFQIDPIDLSTAAGVKVEIPEQVWTGTPADPTAKVTYNGVELVAGKDYTIAGDGSAEVGEHRATIVDVPGGDYEISAGAIYQTYTIKKAEDITFDLNGATVALSKSRFTYTGAVQQPTVGDVTLANGTVIDKSLVSVSVPDSTDAKSYQVTVTGKAANVTGTATASYTIDKAANTLKIAKKTRTAKGVSKAKKTVAGPKVSKKGQGTVTYKKVSVSKNAKKFKVNAKTGKITVKKGTKAGKYKVTVSAKASGNSNYKASSTLKAVVTVKVKK